MRTNNEIIDLLERLRNEQNVSISELARRVDMAKSAVSRYFNRTREFPLNRVDDFAKALHVKPEYILGLETPKASNLTPVTQLTKIPILGEIACGEPILAEENIEGYMDEVAELLPTGTLFYLHCKGDSMEPTIRNGSYVLVRQQPEVEDGEIAAVLVNGNTEATLKRVKHQGNIIMLMPDNPTYSPYIITEDNPARIIGRALEVKFKL